MEKKHLSLLKAGFGPCLLPCSFILLTTVISASAHAKDATTPLINPHSPASALVRHHTHGQIATISSVTAPHNQSRSPAQKPAKESSFWDAEMLPPLSSRSEAYGYPQMLELNAVPPSLLHQGPWGVFNTNSGAAAGWGTVAYYSNVRWAEDWSRLRNDKNRNKSLEALKFIPFNKDETVYMTLSANFENRNFYDQKAGLGTVRKSPAYRNTLRWSAGADLHLGKHVRLYGELLSGQAGGVNYYGYAGGRWRSKIDAQQAFIEVKGHMLGATMGAMAGRMVFLDAPAYITAGSVYPTVPYSWNGLRGYAFWKNFRVDIFDLMLTDTSNPVAFRNKVGWKTRLFGAYTSYALPKFQLMGQKSQIFIDAFYMGYLLANSSIPGATSNIAGSTHRDTPGVKIWGNAGHVEFSTGAMWQGGNFQAANNGPKRSVSAYFLNATVAWRFSKWWSRPAIGIQADDISGGNMHKSATSKWGGFLSPFVPSAFYLDQSVAFGLSNVIDVGPVITLAPTQNTSLLLKVPVVWRHTTNDAVYNNASTAYNFRPHGGYSATLPQANFTWRATRNLTYSIGAEYVFASKALVQSGASSGAFVLGTADVTF